jgi:hypothetical protein
MPLIWPLVKGLKRAISGGEKMSSDFLVVGRKGKLDNETGQQ